MLRPQTLITELSDSSTPAGSVIKTVPEDFSFLAMISEQWKSFDLDISTLTMNSLSNNQSSTALEIETSTAPPDLGDLLAQLCLLKMNAGGRHPWPDLYRSLCHNLRQLTLICIRSLIHYLLHTLTESRNQRAERAESRKTEKSSSDLLWKDSNIDIQWFH